MDVKTCMDSLHKKLRRHLSYRNGKIAGLFDQNGKAYDRLAEISRHIELLTADLRAALIDCHNELQALGYRPPEFPMPDAPDIDVRINGKDVRIIADGIMPFPLKGGVCYLHEKLDAALRIHLREDTLPRPLFDERCAVVFIHRYTGFRHLRDYDNVERRCVTNVIARHFMRDDSPACHISMDLLAPGKSSHTEVRIMTIPAFREFVMSGKTDFTTEGTVSKNVPKPYQKT